MSAPDFFELTLPSNFRCDRIVLQQVGEVVGGDDVTDRDDLDLLAEEPLLVQGAEDEATDATETIDSDTSAHFVLPFRLLMCANAHFI